MGNILKMQKIMNSRSDSLHVNYILYVIGTPQETKALTKYIFKKFFFSVQYSKSKAFD